MKLFLELPISLHQIEARAVQLDYMFNSNKKNWNCHKRRTLSRTNTYQNILYLLYMWPEINWQLFGQPNSRASPSLVNVSLAVQLSKNTHCPLAQFTIFEHQKRDSFILVPIRIFSFFFLFFLYKQTKSIFCSESTKLCFSNIGHLSIKLMRSGSNVFFN